MIRSFAFFFVLLQKSSNLIDRLLITRLYGSKAKHRCSHRLMETNDGIRIGKVVYSDDLSTVLSANKDIMSFEIIRGVRCIGCRAFSGCRKLRVVRIPETVIRIEDYAFQDCSAIQDIYLPYYI